MRYRYLFLIAAFAATQAFATGKPDHCQPSKPDVKTPEVKSPAKAEPKAEPRAQPDHDRPCEQQEIKPYWCPRP